MIRRSPVAVAAMILAAMIPAAAPVGAAPTRIVSMNLCADELLLRLAPPGRLVSVTWLAAGPAAIDAGAAAGLTLNHGRAEEIARLRPDLVVAGRYTTATTTAMLRRAGIPVRLLDEATSLDGIRDQVTSLAATVGNPDAGVAMLARMDAMLAAARPAPDDQGGMPGWWYCGPAAALPAPARFRTRSLRPPACAIWRRMHRWMAMAASAWNGCCG
ncbi:ABC transporter substrate-binding protein [Tistrella bauzanensis]